MLLTDVSPSGVPARLTLAELQETMTAPRDPYDVTLADVRVQRQGREQAEAPDVRLLPVARRLPREDEGEVRREQGE